VISELFQPIADATVLATAAMIVVSPSAG